MKQAVTTTLMLLFVGLLGGGVSVSAQGLAQQVAIQYVQDNVELFGLTQADVSDIVVADAYRTEHNGITHVYLKQRYQGIEVHNALLSINVKEGRVFSHGNRFTSDLASKVAGGAGLSATSALSAAASHVDLVVSGSVDVIEQPSGIDQKGVLSASGVSKSPVPVQLVYQPTEDGQVRLAWDVGIDAQGSDSWWQVRVDAATGALLEKNDLTVHDSWDVAAYQPAYRLVSTPAPLPLGMMHTPLQSQSMPNSYNVFPLPAESPDHPISTGGTPQTVVVDPADPTFSPFGWHDTDGVAGAEFTITRGNNVHAYEDRDGNDTPPNPSNEPDGGATLEFNFPVDLTQEPTTYVDGATVNLFYYSNIIHDILGHYGFDEASGNFQEFNYTPNGVGNDYVRAQAQARADQPPSGQTRCNANFFTPSDGSRPRMRMYVCANTSPARDGDFDNGVIAHEYGHGVSNRLTGGPNASGCLSGSEQMGEGWSDFFGVMLSQVTGETGAQARGIGTYLFGQAPNGPGIRARPYSTDFAVNEFTYDNIKTASVPHGVGHVWNTMLWDLNWALIGELFPELGGGDNGNGGGSGFNPNLYLSGDDPAAGGNNLAMQLVMDGMKMQPCSPGFVDGRNAILEADEAMTPGADGDWMTTDGHNAAIIWNVFARRGLGWSADQGSSASRSDGTEAFDIPASLQAVAISGTVVLEGGTPVPGVTVDFSDAGVPDEDTDAAGTFAFTSPTGNTVSITPTDQGNIPAANNSDGVDVFDILATRRHILANPELGSPYQIIAADTDADADVDVFDILAQRQLVLNEVVPAGGLWRFVSSDQVFADPSDPLAEVLETSREYDPLTVAQTAQDFVAMKQGDVDASWTAPGAPATLAKRGGAVGTVRLSLEESLEKQGEEVVVWVRAEAFEEVAGLQMTVSWSPDVLAYRGLAGTDLPGVSESSFGRRYEDEGHLTALWDDARAAGVTLSAGSAVFGLRFAVVGAGDRRVELGSSVLEAVAVRGGDLGVLSVASDGATVTSLESSDRPETFALLGNYPNPFNPSTTIRFDLPETAEVRVEVVDLLGRVVLEVGGEEVAAGSGRSIQVDGSRLSSGVYLYRVVAETATDRLVQTGRMTLVK